jgi:hypothetical protein
MLREASLYLNGFLDIYSYFIIISIFILFLKLRFKALAGIVSQASNNIGFKITFTAIGILDFLISCKSFLCRYILGAARVYFMDFIIGHAIN